MNTLKNTVTLVGNLGKDPMLTKFGDNNAVARFSVATNESYKDKNGEWITNTTWHNIVAWNPLAELCEKLLKKGSEIMLEGKIVNDSYKTENGEIRQKIEISMRQFILINRESHPDKKLKNK